MTVEQQVSVAVVQWAPALADREGNLAAMIAQLRQLAAQGAQLVVFPEASVTGYVFDSADQAADVAELREAPDGSAVVLGPVCDELGVWVVAGTLTTRDGTLYNSALVVGPGGQCFWYDKTHLPFLGVDRFTEPGPGPFEVFDLGFVKLGVLICYDGGFAEPARCLALAGADLIVLPTNWPSGADNLAKYVSNTRALENHVYFAASGRVGVENGTTFIGGSRICDPFGNTLAQAPDSTACTLMATIEPTKARQKQIVRVPGKSELNRLADRRPALYGSIVE